jgi:uncharacterized protein (DUF3084 family)
MTDPSPYWTEYVKHLPETGTVTIVPGDLRRLVAQLHALQAEVERARADAEHEHYLRRCAETERNRVQRELDRRTT